MESNLINQLRRIRALLSQSGDVGNIKNSVFLEIAAQTIEDQRNAIETMRATVQSLSAPQVKTLRDEWAMRFYDATAQWCLENDEIFDDIAQVKSAYLSADKAIAIRKEKGK